jgi:hypothetical protein
MISYRSSPSIYAPAGSKIDEEFDLTKTYAIESSTNSIVFFIQLESVFIRNLVRQRSAVSSTENIPIDRAYWQFPSNANPGLPARFMLE